MKRLLFLIAILSINKVIAQKLPNTQQISLRTPVNVKIDGRATEWNNKFQAYNKSTRIYYTISNDRNNIYLVVHVSDFETIKKILLNGVTFTLKKVNERSDSTAMAITFPLYDQGLTPLVLSSELRSKSRKEATLNTDSFANAYNQRIPTVMKLIGVQGFSNVKDGFISVYNDLRIKAAARFDKAMDYTYELTIPYTSIALPSEKVLKYSLQLNGQQKVNGYPVTSLPGRSNILMYVDDKGVTNYLGNSPQDVELYYPTSFHGEYMISK